MSIKSKPRMAVPVISLPCSLSALVFFTSLQHRNTGTGESCHSKHHILPSHDSTTVVPSASPVTLDSSTHTCKTRPGYQPATTAPCEQSAPVRVLTQSMTPPLSSQMPPLLLPECQNAKCHAAACPNRTSPQGLPGVLKARGRRPLEEAGDRWPATATFC